MVSSWMVDLRVKTPKWNVNSKGKWAEMIHAEDELAPILTPADADDDAHRDQAFDNMVEPFNPYDEEPEVMEETLLDDEAPF